jgi:hypothetical protein
MKTAKMDITATIANNYRRKKDVSLFGTWYAVIIDRYSREIKREE